MRSHVTMKGFSAFLDIREEMQGLGAWNPVLKVSVSKDLFHQFPWSTECLTLHPETPAGSVESRQLQQHRLPAKAHAAVAQLRANALGKCQFVVDSTSGAGAPEKGIKNEHERERRGYFFRNNLTFDYFLKASKYKRNIHESILV